jgi:hypothetical protein
MNAHSSDIQNLLHRPLDMPERQRPFDTFDGAKPRFLNRGKKHRSVSTLSIPRASDRGVEWVDLSREVPGANRKRFPLCDLGASAVGLGFFLCFMLAFPLVSHAASPEFLSMFQPYISVQETYDSNIDLVPENPTDDFITAVYPGLRFSTLGKSETTGQYRLPSSSLEGASGMNFDYRAGFFFYAKESDRDYIGVDGTLNAWYTLERRWAFQLRNYTIRSQDSREADYSSTALPGEYLLSTQRILEPYTRNVVAPSVAYQFGKENRVSLTYVNNIYRTDDPLSQDSLENAINPQLAYWFDARNGITLEYGLTFAEFERDADWTGQTAQGRYMHRFNPRTSGFVDYFFRWVDFDFPGNDFSVNRPSVGMEHAFSRTLSGKAQVGFFVYDPDVGPSYTRPFYNLLLTQLAGNTTYNLSFFGGYTEDYFTSENLGFTLYHRGVGNITHRLTRDLTLGLTGSLERAEYPRTFGLIENREDWIYGVWGKVSYQVLRWLLLGLDVSYTQDSSNFEINEYKDFRAVFNVTATYF